MERERMMKRRRTLLVALLLCAVSLPGRSLVAQGRGSGVGIHAGPLTLGRLTDDDSLILEAPGAMSIGGAFTIAVSSCWALRFSAARTFGQQSLGSEAAGPSSSALRRSRRRAGHDSSTRSS